MQPLSHGSPTLYFNGRNAMLYDRIHNYDPALRVPPERLVMLRVSAAVLDLQGVVITDINAAADVEPRWYTVREGLPTLDAREIYAQYWNHADPRRKRDHRQRMMAEVLVPDHVPVRWIEGAYVASAAVARHVSRRAPTLRTEVKPYMFFQGGRP